MPILKQEQETREIILPESGAKVTILKKITYGTMIKIWSAPEDEKSTRLAIALAAIVDWDFTDDKLAKLPINAENLKWLDKNDGEFLVDEISKDFTEKKTSISK